jgi:hypothetical protein
MPACAQTQAQCEEKRKRITQLASSVQKQPSGGLGFGMVLSMVRGARVSGRMQAGSGLGLKGIGSSWGGPGEVRRLTHTHTHMNVL